MGHPNRLRQLFRKYDVDRNGEVSKDEFLSALLGHNIPISRDECLFLVQVADTEDRGLISYEVSLPPSLPSSLSVCVCECWFVCVSGWEGLCVCVCACVCLTWRAVLVAHACLYAFSCTHCLTNIHGQGFISVVEKASFKPRPQTALTERSTDSINSVHGRKASVSSQNSMSSVRSSMSVRSERSTSSFASSVSGVTRERSGFLMDGSLRDKERRAHRATALEVYMHI
jgi:hypothetical protein